MYKFVNASSSDKRSTKKKEAQLPPILQISSEFRAPIWAYVGSSDKRNIRLVCKALENDVDTKIGFPVNLDERKFVTLDVAKTLPPSASKLRVWGSEFTQSYVNRLLLNSRLVTFVSFSGPTDVVNFTKILTRCPNLISVNVTDRGVFAQKLRMILKLRNIQILNLGTEAYISDYNNTISNTALWSTYDDILKHVALPCLRILSIEYTTSNTSPPFKEIIASVLKYLITHKTVKDLTLRLKTGRVYPKKEGELYDLEFTSAQLGLVKLNKLILELDGQAFKIADILLPKQDSMEFFDCWNYEKDWDYFNQIIDQNAETLKTVKIRKLNPTPDSRIDLSVFEKCKQLNELLLTRFGNTTQEVCYGVAQNPGECSFLDKNSSKLPEMIKFKSLPSSLTKLHIQGFTVKTEDLSWIPIKLINLQVLELQMLGYHGPAEVHRGSIIPRDFSRQGLGVTPAILKDVFTKLRKLDTLFVEEFYNNRTALKESKFQKVVGKINLIPGQSLTKLQGYFGIFIKSKEPYGHISRAERNDQWDSRLNQYLL